jgi:hypothetical protein
MTIIERLKELDQRRENLEREMNREVEILGYACNFTYMAWNSTIDRIKDLSKEVSNENQE